MQLFGCTSDQISFGHRFHANHSIKINKPSDYENQLLENHVMVCPQAREARIENQVRKLAQPLSLRPDLDPELKSELAGLVEWPMALMGSFESDFLKIPKESLVATMKSNQKYIPLYINKAEGEGEGKEEEEKDNKQQQNQ